MPRRTTLSAASATPAPSLKDALELLADAIDEIIGLESLRAPQEASYRPISNARAYVAQATAILEAQPAAEMTALARTIRAEKKDVLSMFAYQGPPSRHWIDTEGRYYEGWNAAIDKVLAEIDAQERAGAKAASEQGGA